MTSSSTTIKESFASADKNVATKKTLTTVKESPNKQNARTITTTKTMTSTVAVSDPPMDLETTYEAPPVALEAQASLLEDEGIEDFSEAETVVMNKETKKGHIVETKGTLAKHVMPTTPTVAIKTTTTTVITTRKDDAGSAVGNPVEKGDEEADSTKPSHEDSNVETEPTQSETTTTVTTTTSTIVDESANVIDKASRRFVTPKDFDMLKVIGMGAFGKVLQVRHKHTNQILAMKVISKRLLMRKSGYVENIQAERKILTRVRSPFVVTMHCSFQTREKLFIIMDFLAGGELFLRLGREGIFLEKPAAFYLAEIILALDHLHSLGILHRDLKPENILLGADGHVCVTDFGLAKEKSDDSNDDEDTWALTICGTQEYMAPEMLSGKGYGRPADYWSLGCIAYEMLAGLPPFKSHDGRKELFRRIMSEKVKMPPGSTAEACKLLKGLLNRNVQNRLGTTKSTMFEVGGVAALKNQKFFSHINWDKLANKEMSPPEVLAVENDQDLKHFHEEFTGMALPRSVVLMSQENFQPHHINSDRFRGFSFIHEGFPLPDRPENEQQSYWDSVEEDGESVSECASSKMGSTDALETASIATDTASAVKKRPPRKRKKKKNASADNTPAASAATTPVPSEAGDTLTNEKSPIPPLQEKSVECEGLSAKAEREEDPNPKPLQEPANTPTAANGAVPPNPKLKPVEPQWQSIGTSPGYKGMQAKTQQETVQNNQRGKQGGDHNLRPGMEPQRTPKDQDATPRPRHGPPNPLPQASRPTPWAKSKQQGTGAWGKPRSQSAAPQSKQNTGGWVTPSSQHAAPVAPTSNSGTGRWGASRSPSTTPSMAASAQGPGGWGQPLSKQATQRSTVSTQDSGGWGPPISKHAAPAATASKQRSAGAWGPLGLQKPPPTVPPEATTVRVAPPQPPAPPPPPALPSPSSDWRQHSMGSRSSFSSSSSPAQRQYKAPQPQQWPGLTAEAKPWPSIGKTATPKPVLKGAWASKAS